jgi:carbonic anhydrase
MRFAGNEDEKLKQFKEYVNNAVAVFVDALPKMTERMSFKAFDIDDIGEEEAKNFADIILTQFAIRLKEVVPDTLEKYTYNGSIVTTEQNTTQVWFHAENKKPDAPERIELQDDIDASAKGMLQDKDAPVVEEVLVAASGMGHVEPEDHYINRTTYDA